MGSPAICGLPWRLPVNLETPDRRVGQLKDLGMIIEMVPKENASRLVVCSENFGLQRWSSEM